MQNYIDSYFTEGTNSNLTLYNRNLYETYFVCLKI